MRHTMRRLTAVTLTTLAALTTALAVTGTAHAAGLAPKERCGYWHNVDPATAPGQGDVLARSCVEWQPSGDATPTAQVRTRTEAKLASGVCCTRGIYLNRNLTIVGTDDSTTDYPDNEIEAGTQRVITAGQTLTVYGTWRTTTTQTGTVSAEVMAARNASYVGAVQFSSGALTFGVA